MVETRLVKLSPEKVHNTLRNYFTEGPARTNTVDEPCELVKAGFDYTTIDGV